jgi:hypothetical protein
MREAGLGHPAGYSSPVEYGARGRFCLKLALSGAFRAENAKKGPIRPLGMALHGDLLGHREWSPCWFEVGVGLCPSSQSTRHPKRRRVTLGRRRDDRKTGRKHAPSNGLDAERCDAPVHRSMLSLCVHLSADHCALPQAWRRARRGASHPDIAGLHPHVHHVGGADGARVAISPRHLCALCGCMPPVCRGLRAGGCARPADAGVCGGVSQLCRCVRPDGTGALRHRTQS